MKRWILSAMALILALMAGAAVAQDAPGGSAITFNGVSFSFDASVAQGVWASQAAGTAPDAPPEPGSPFPPGQTFVFTGTATSPGQVLPGTDSINVYPLSGFEQYGADSPVNQQLQALQTLLADKPDLAGVTSLPYLPLATGGFAFIARAEYMETDTLTGVRYLTDIRNDVSPTLDGQVRYVFLGLTKDGNNVVSARYHVLTGVLPTQPDATMSYDAFAASYEEYTANLAAQLSELDASSFTPSLADLDALIATISVAGA